MHGLTENVANNARATHVAAIRALQARGQYAVDVRTQFDHPYAARGFDTREAAATWIADLQDQVAGLSINVHVPADVAA